MYLLPSHVSHKGKTPTSSLDYSDYNLGFKGLLDSVLTTTIAFLCAVLHFIASAFPFSFLRACALAEYTSFLAERNYVALYLSARNGLRFVTLVPRRFS